MAMENAAKAIDTLVGANYLREDLSDVMTLTFDPARPIQAQLAHGRARNTTHQWNDIALSAPTGTSASYNEGNKPYSTNVSPLRRSNVTARFGRTARVTDEQAATWTGGGAYSLADGEMTRMYAESIELETEVQMAGVLNEVEYVTVNGAAANNSIVLGAEVSQFDGMYLGCATGHIPGIGGPGVVQPASAAPLSYAMLQSLALAVENLQGPWKPDTLLVSVHDKNLANSFQTNVRVNGGPGTDFTGMTAGYEVDRINTGFSVVNILVTHYLPSGTAVLCNLSKNFKYADLIPLGTEPLAKINTTVERLVNYVTTLECQALATTTGVITGLSTT